MGALMPVVLALGLFMSTTASRAAAIGHSELFNATAVTFDDDLYQSDELGGEDTLLDYRRGRTLLGIDTKGSRKPYGHCHAVTAAAKHGHWCKKGTLPGKPSRSNLKYGRQTMYGSPKANWKTWCGMKLGPKKDMAMCALSTKYIKGRSPHSPYCGKCICIRFKGSDMGTNPHPPQNAKKYFGRTMKCRVCDQCPECTDDQIDILAAKPYIPSTIASSAAWGVGVWAVEWNFVPCGTNCNKFFKRK